MMKRGHILKPYLPALTKSNIQNTQTGCEINIGVAINSWNITNCYHIVTVFSQYMIDEKYPAFIIRIQVILKKFGLHFH